MKTRGVSSRKMVAPLTEWLPVAGPSITDREVRYAADAARNAWYASAGDYPRRFEEAFAEWVGVRHAISLPSCTSGIHLALAALQIGPGDEVVVPEITWIASTAPIHYVNATPVFVDVDPVTWCLDPESLRRAITPRTRAVIGVDLYGNMADWRAIETIAAEAGLALIEDAAQAHGATLDGRRAGSFGDAGVFSFHGSKILTTGEGGMLVTDRDDLAARCRVLRDHGRAPRDRQFFNAEVAFKYKMSALQAAVGLAQLERVDELLLRKVEIFEWYRERLADTPGLSLNKGLPDSTSVYWMVTAVLDPALALPKELVARRLADVEIDSRPFFHPLSTLPAFAASPSVAGAAERNVVAHRLAPWGINLPSGFNMDEPRVDRVCRALLDAIDRGPSP